MAFVEIVDQIVALLRDRARISYRVLKREFALDDEQLEDLKVELIDAQRVARDEDGKVLVWTGASPVSSSQLSVASSPQPSTPQPVNPEFLTVQPLIPKSQSPAGFTEGFDTKDLQEAKALLEQLA